MCRLVCAYCVRLQERPADAPSPPQPPQPPPPPSTTARADDFDDFDDEDDYRELFRRILAVIKDNL